MGSKLILGINHGRLSVYAPESESRIVRRGQLAVRRDESMEGFHRASSRTGTDHPAGWGRVIDGGRAIWGQSRSIFFWVFIHCRQLWAIESHIFPLSHQLVGVSYIMHAALAYCFGVVQHITLSRLSDFSPMHSWGTLMPIVSPLRGGISEQVLAMYTREEQGHVCGDSSSLILEEHRSGTSAWPGPIQSSQPDWRTLPPD